MQGMQVVGLPVVLYHSSIFQLVGGDDREVALSCEFCPMDRFSSLGVASTFLEQHRSGETEPDMSIDTSASEASFGPALLGIVLENRHFVSQETRCLAASMGDQGFLFREGQFQFFPQEGAEVLLDFLCFRFGAGEREREIVSVPTVLQPSVGWITRVDRGESLRLFLQ